MKLTHIRIKDFRSFSGEHDFDVSSGVNYFVGPNNCGKSNLIRALELALDPDAIFGAERDRPAHDQGGKPPITRITLTFGVGESGPEATLLRRAHEYEMAVRKVRKAPIGDGVQTQRERGFGAGELLAGLAAAQLAGEDFLTGLDRQRADAAGQQVTPVPGLASTTAAGLARRVTPAPVAGSGDLAWRQLPGGCWTCCPRRGPRR